MLRRTSFVILALLAATPAKAAVVIVEKSALKSSGTEVATTLHIDRNRVRIDSSSAGGAQSFIFLADRGVFWILDPKAKTYREMTKADLERMMGQFGDVMKQVEEKLKNLPPEQRKALEGMLAGKMGDVQTRPSEPITYKKVSSGTKMNRWTCDRYEGFRGAQKVSEICATDWKQLGVTMDDFGALQGLTEFFKSVGPLVGGGRGGDDVFSVGGGTAGYEGIPVQRMSFVNGQPQSTSEVTDVRREDLPDTLFQVPGDYKLVAMPGMPAMPRN